jgi:Ion channel
MANKPDQSRTSFLRMHVSEFWSGDLGLTLVTIALVLLIFVVTPLREYGLRGRIFLDLSVLVLMISGALVVDQSRIATAAIVAVVTGTAVVLVSGRLHPTLFLHLLGSLLVTISLLLYVGIVLLLTLRGGHVTWSRVQGGISAYLLLGLAFASAYQFVEQLHPGAFRFVSQPADLDQLTAKFTYYSFTTLTTVGSDISPVFPFARSLTIAEAVLGQLFPAVLMGALVAMALQSRESHRDPS